MIVLERTGMSRADWDRTLILSSGNPLHQPEVLLVDHPPNRLLFLLLREGGITKGCTVGVRTGAGWRRRLLRQSTLYLPTFPAVREDVQFSEEAIFRSLLQYCQRNGFTRLSIDGRWGRDFSDSDLFANSIVRTFVEFEMRTDQTEETLLSSMDKYHRKNIRRAERNGVSVEIDSSLEGLNRLRELQLISADRATKRGNPFGVRDQAYFSKIQDLLYRRGLGEVAFAKKGGEFLAGLAYLLTKDRAITVRSGATAMGFENNATYLLQYRVLLRLREAGIRQVNLGGVPQDAIDSGHPQHGLYSFKKGFGGKPNVRTSVDIDVRERIGRTL